jgi:hypothetical protein
MNLHQNFVIRRGGFGDLLEMENICGTVFGVDDCFNNVRSLLGAAKKNYCDAAQLIPYTPITQLDLAGALFLQVLEDCD